MGKLRIKSAEITDIPLIRKLAMQVWPQTYTPILGVIQVDYMLDKFYAPEELKKQMQEPDHHFCICYYENDPAAFASWSLVEPHVYKLHKLYVHPGRQGNGIGRFMISYIIDDVRSRQATALRLNVNRYNHLAIAFYEQLGFSHLKDEDIDIGSGYFMNDHVLVKLTSIPPVPEQGKAA
jgi:diamine N-acetyltransferase